MIIPGFIGGRMVKFLEEISVTDKESDNFYHYHDNRVMPPHVDEELAKKEGECSLCATHLFISDTEPSQQCWQLCQAGS